MFGRRRATGAYRSQCTRVSQQLLAVTAPQTSYTQREGYVFDKKISTSMKGLKELFSDPTLATRASFRCSTERPSEIDVMMESILLRTANIGNGLNGFTISVSSLKCLTN